MASDNNITEPFYYWPCLSYAVWRHMGSLTLHAQVNDGERVALRRVQSQSLAVCRP